LQIHTKKKIFVNNNAVKKICDYIDNANYQAAKNICNEIILTDPDNFIANYYLGVITYKQGQLNLFINYVSKAVSIFHSGEADEQDIKYFKELAKILISLKQYDLAELCLKVYLDIAKEDQASTFDMGVIFMQRFEYDKALHWFLKSKKFNSSFQLLINIAHSLYFLGRFNEAESYLQKAIKKSPKEWHGYQNLGMLMLNQKRTDEAIKYFKLAIKASPYCDNAYYSLSEIPSYIKNPQNRKNLISTILTLINDVLIDRTGLINLNFALGRLYRRDNQFDKEFECYLRVSKIKSETSTYNIDYYLSGAQFHKKIFTADFFRKKSSYGHQSNKLIFIVGTPRSSTSLTEQILASHSKIHGIGETTYIARISRSTKPLELKATKQVISYPQLLDYLSKEEIYNLAETYLDRIREKDFPEIKKIIDKMPENYSNIGFIKLIFPNAIIINCKRHPIASIFSMFSNNLDHNHFPYSIIDLAKYYKCYIDIMKHWHKVLPGQIYDSYYDDLVINTEQKSKDLIKLCGLEWEDQCLNFYNSDRPVLTLSYSQVRQPIYQDALNRWKLYEKYLEPAKEILRDEITEYEEAVKQFEKK